MGNLAFFFSTAIWQLEAKPAGQFLPVRRGLRGDDLARRRTVERRALQLSPDIHLQKGNRYVFAGSHSAPQTRSSHTRGLPWRSLVLSHTITVSHRLSYLCRGCQLNWNQMSTGRGTENMCISSLVALWDLYDPAVVTVVKWKRKDTFLKYLSPTSQLVTDTLALGSNMVLILVFTAHYM